METSKTIATTNGIEFIVDGDDYQYLSQFNWHGLVIGGHWRAHVKLNGKIHYMHRIILGLVPGDGKSTDHIDGNALNNRRQNLRVCTHAQNRRNSKINSNNSSGYRGVSLTTTGRWRARIKTMYKEKWLGVFNTPEEAALAYNIAAIQEHDQYARLNRIADGPCVI